MSFKWTRDVIESLIVLIQHFDVSFFLLYFHSQKFANKNLCVEKLSKRSKETRKNFANKNLLMEKGTN